MISYRSFYLKITQGLLFVDFAAVLDGHVVSFLEDNLVENAHARVYKGFCGVGGGAGDC